MAILDIFEQARQRKQQEQRMSAERQKFLDDPLLGEKLLAHTQALLVPEKAREKLGGAANLAKVEKAIPEGDPRKGMSKQVLETFHQTLPMLPKDVSPVDALNHIYGQMVSAKGEETNRWYQEQESGWFTRKDIPKPYGYDEWKEKFLKETSPQHSIPGEVLASIPGNMAFGASMAGLGQLSRVALTKPVEELTGRVAEGLVGEGVKDLLANRTLTTAGKAVAKLPFGGWATGKLLAEPTAGMGVRALLVLGKLMGMTPPAGHVGIGMKLAGAAITMGALMVGFDTARAALEKTEWARQRPWSTVAVAGAIDAAAGYGLRSALKGKLAKSAAELLGAKEAVKGTAETLSKSPTAENILSHFDASTELTKSEGRSVAEQERVLQTIASKRRFEDIGVVSGGEKSRVAMPPFYGGLKTEVGLGLEEARERVATVGKALPKTRIQSYLSDYEQDVSQRASDLMTEGIERGEAFKIARETTAKITAIKGVNEAVDSPIKGIDQRLRNLSQAGVDSVLEDMSAGTHVNAALRTQESVDSYFRKPLGDVEAGELGVDLDLIHGGEGKVPKTLASKIAEVGKFQKTREKASNDLVSKTSELGEAPEFNIVPEKSKIESSSTIPESLNEMSAKVNKNRVVPEPKTEGEVLDHITNLQRKHAEAFFKNPRSLDSETFLTLYDSVADPNMLSRDHNLYRKEIITKIKESLAETPETVQQVGAKVIEELDKIPAKVTSKDITALKGKIVEGLGEKKGKVVLDKASAVLEQTAVETGKKVKPADYLEILHILSKNKFRSLVIGGLALGGTTIALGEIPGFEETAYAGIPDNAARTVSKAVIDGAAKYKDIGDLFKQILDGGFASPAVTKDTLTLERQWPVIVPASAENITWKQKLPFGLNRILSKDPLSMIYYGPQNGKELLTKPATHLAMAELAGKNNGDAAVQIFHNIMNKFGVEAGEKEIAEVMKPLNEKYTPLQMEMTHRYALLKGIRRVKSESLRDLRREWGMSPKNFREALKEFKGKTKVSTYDPAKELEDMLSQSELNEIPQEVISKVAAEKVIPEILTKSKKGQLEEIYNIASKENKLHLEEIKKLKGSLDKMGVEAESLYKQLAQTNPDTRVFLAAEGFEAHPWLKSLMKENELGAAAKLRELMEEHAAASAHVGLDVIKAKGYMHYASHPSTDWNSIQQRLQTIPSGVAREPVLTEYFSRALGSKSMMPSAWYSTERYLPDANRRIANADFWGKKRPDGWYKHMNSNVVQDNDGLRMFWESIKEAVKPYDSTPINKLAERMQNFEVFRLLSLSPSVSFKHGIKLEANWSNFGISHSLKALPLTSKLYARAMIPNSLRGESIVEDAVVKAFIGQRNNLRAVTDLVTVEAPGGLWDKLTKLNEKGAFFVNAVENFDRAHSIASASLMSMTKGMTPAQAAYGIMDTILKTNFLAGAQNPAWLRDPKVRLLMLFQGTPFKIAEQRAVLAWRAGKSIKESGLELLRQLKSDVKEGEHRLKYDAIKTAFTNETDMWGTSVTSQAMRKMLILGSIVGVGKYAFDSNLSAHVFHLPFVKPHDKTIGLALNPMASSAWEAWHKKDTEESEPFMWEFIKTWLKDPFVQNNVIKAMRLSKDDIPAIYRDSKIRYLLSVPAVKEKE